MVVVNLVRFVVIPVCHYIPMIVLVTFLVFMAFVLFHGLARFISPDDLVPVVPVRKPIRRVGLQQSPTGEYAQQKTSHCCLSEGSNRLESAAKERGKILLLFSSCNE